MNISYIIAGFILVPSALLAQERTAMGNLQQEASWSALKSMVEAAQGQAKSSLILSEAITRCGNKGMLYAPEYADKDGEGCREIAKVGASCDFKAISGCNNSTCRIRYLDRKTGKVVIHAVPDIWHDGEVYVWMNNSDNFVGGQCRNGMIVRWGTGL